MPSVPSAPRRPPAPPPPASPHRPAPSAHFESWRQHAQQLDAYTEPDQGRHAAVLHRGRKLYPAGVYGAQGRGLSMGSVRRWLHTAWQPEAQGWAGMNVAAVVCHCPKTHPLAWALQSHMPCQRQQRNKTSATPSTLSTSRVGGAARCAPGVGALYPLQKGRAHAAGRAARLA